MPAAATDSATDTIRAGIVLPEELLVHAGDVCRQPDGTSRMHYVEQGEGTFARRDVAGGSATDADRVQVTAGRTPTTE